MTLFFTHLHSKFDAYSDPSLAIGRSMFNVLSLLLLTTTIAPAQPNRDDQNSEIVIVPGGQSFLRWYGHANRTYFLQVSDQNNPLGKWNWAPFIEVGNNAVISHQFGGITGNAFFRLSYTGITPAPGETLEGADFDNDGLANWDEITFYFTDPLNRDTDGDGMHDSYECSQFLDPNFDDGQYDYDQDGLTNLAEYNAATDPFDLDSDDDGMDDGFEVTHSFDPLDATDAISDEDSDGLSNLWEFKLGLNPQLTDSNNNGVSDPLEDRDGDELTNIAELITHNTLPDQPDTDDDGLGDGWEAYYGYSPLINNETDASPDNDPDADPDNDGLINRDEYQIGTNPNNADSDGDGFTDIVEDRAGSNPTGAASTPSNPGGTPGGPAAPPPPTIPVEVNFGDHSESHSEKYKVWLEPLEGDANPKKRYRTNRKYGQTQTETFHLPAGAKYKITLSHIGSDPSYSGDPKPDFDYTLEFTSKSADVAIAAISEDSAGILGVHGESESFFAKGKEAKLNIAWLKSETVASIPADRKRTKIGVGENVDLTLKPSSLPSPTWALTGDIELSFLDTNTGITTKLTAGARKCSPTAEATINGQIVKIAFEVVEPTGVGMRQQPGSGIQHTMGIPSAGFKGIPYITPDDVSFAGGTVNVREEVCNATGTGYYSYANGNIHAQGPWKPVIVGDATNPSKVDTIDHIYSGNDGPATPSIGSFDWVIPMSFQVNGGGVKQFTTITHHNECDLAGTVSIQKGTEPFSAHLNDPTVP